MDRREILTQVAEGKLTPEEAAEQLEELKPPSPQASVAPEVARRIRIVGDFLSAKVSSDPLVVEAVAEGPHSATREGDTLVITARGGEGDSAEFRFSKSDRPRFVIGLGARPRPLAVRMNPDLPLEVEIDAGSLSVSGVRAHITASIDAGAIKVNDSASPFTLSVDAGSVQVAGVLDGGDSSITCDAGSVKVMLRQGSSVRVSARADIGKVVVGDSGARGVQIGSGAREGTFGEGAGTLDIRTGVGRILVQEQR